MDYQGYKLIDKIMLICRDKAEHEGSGDYCRSNHYKNIYQAYLVDPSNKNQLKAAQRWAEWTEYGPSHKNTETGKWEREYEIPHKPVEFEFDNNGFELELLDCAGGSSQGGKLSFWNCIVTKDNNSFVIGINSDMLLDLLKNASFEKGKCQSSLIFITQKGKVGMTVEGSETYKQCIKDKELMSTFKKMQTSKFTFGDKVSTATINEVYLGPITKYYEFDIGQNNRYRCDVCYSYCTLRKLAKPVTHYLFDWYPKEDVALSILQAVVNQTISGLACGKPIKGNVIFLGGPLTYLPMLRERFIKTLDLKEEEVIIPEDACLFVCMGALLDKNKSTSFTKEEITKLIDKLNKFKEENSNTLRPLFKTRYSLGMLHYIFTCSAGRNVKFFRKAILIF